MLAVGDVGSGGVQCLHQRIAMAAHDDAAVVRRVQGLVAIEGPGIGQLDAPGQVIQRLAGGRPQAEGAVDVYPGPGLFRF